MGSAVVEEAAKSSKQSNGSVENVVDLDVAREVNL